MSFKGYPRFPTIHGNQIIFTAEDDLWLLGDGGGRAERLTAGVAEATHPRFSPDGHEVAFTGRDEGPAEVYIMPVDGGSARRLSFHGSNAMVAGWAPGGGSVLFASDAGQPRFGQRILYSVSRDGGEPESLPFGVANAIAYGPGDALVLGRHIAEPARWKRYRGGTAGHLWVDPDGSRQFRRLLNFNTNVSSPCWIGDRIYFISDHEGIGNVYSCLPSGEDLRRHTSHEDYYARSLSTDGDRLVYHAGAELYLLDSPSSTSGRRLDVDLTGTRTQRSRKFVAAGRYLDTWSLQPQGNRVALTARGKGFSMGAFEGPVLQQGDPDGTRYRLLSWLADGNRLVGIADDGSEPRLVVFSSTTGAEPPRVLEKLDIGTVSELRPSPVDDKVVLLNHRCEVLLVDLATESLTVVDKSQYARTEIASHVRGSAWSPDGRWIAYAYAASAQQTAIKIYNVATGQSEQVTDPILHDTRPAFDPGGRYLYFLSAREFDPVMDNLHFGWSFPKGVRPYLIALQRESRSPFTPEPASSAPAAPPADSSPATAAQSGASGSSESGSSEPGAETNRPVVRIDFEGIRSRIVAFPVPEGRYGRVQGTHSGVVYSSFPVESARKDEEGSSSAGALDSYHFEQHKTERLLEGISDFEVNARGTTLIYQSGERLRIVKAGEKLPHLEGEAQNKPGRESGWLDLDRVQVSVRPEAEWRQMLGEAWRLQREQFWNADMSGVDWPGMYLRYSRLLDRIGSRSELSDLFWEMQGELGTSHAYEYGGEYRPHPQYHQGFLGVDWHFEEEEQRYIIGHLVSGDSWDAEATSPLLAPGINAVVGDAVLAINGQRLQRDLTPGHLLVNQAGGEVELLLQPKDGGPTRTVVVRALGREYSARYREWVEKNRRVVHESTGGKVGYIHIPDMGNDGFAEFHRSYLMEYDREGLIVDVRWNRGGILSNLLLETLMRPRIGYGFQRWGQSEPYFIESPRGPMVALTNESAGSDGDIFSHAFKMLKLGPLIGKRTWGGVIGYNDFIFPLADGTVTTQPEFSFWFTDVGWGVENYGVDPTIEVEYPPQAYMAQEDPQLDRGIAEVLHLITSRPAGAGEPGPRPNLRFPPKV